MDTIQAEAGSAASGGRRAVVSRLGEGRSFDAVPGEIMTIRVLSSSVGGRFTIIDTTIAPMASPPMHYHREEEIFEILEGTMTFVCDGKRIEAEAGTIVLVSPGQHHSFINLTDKPIKMRVTFAPGGIEQTIFPFIAGKSPAEIGKLAARHGTLVVGPPLNSTLRAPPTPPPSAPERPWRRPRRVCRQASRIKPFRASRNAAVGPLRRERPVRTPSE